MFAKIWKWLSRPHGFAGYPEHIRTAAFRFIDMPSLTPSYLGGSISQIANRRLVIANKRKRLGSIADTELRECVASWLDYYESRLPEQERELTERISAKGLDEYRARRKAEDAKVVALLRSQGLA